MNELGNELVLAYANVLSLGDCFGFLILYYFIKNTEKNMCSSPLKMVMGS